VSDRPGLVLVVAGLVVLSLIVTLVMVRAGMELVERRRARRAGEVRALLLTALLGEPDETEDALAALRSRRGRAWAHIEEQAFRMLPKVKGDAHLALVELLLSRGASARAEANANSRSGVRRSRGAYQLGALGRQGAVGTLLALLSDGRFVVRRMAVRALGQIRDPEAVGPLLDAVDEDPALARDVMAAFQRIGPDAAPPLRGDLETQLTALPAAAVGRRGALAAAALGLLGDVGATGLLTRALADTRQPGLAAAAAEALGQLGVPGAVGELIAALSATDEELRLQAARALGRIGDASVVPGLAQTLGTGSHEVERAVAAALLRLGPAGQDALAVHGSPYAAEALAVHRLRTTA
jgi:HEAT repeat protein